MDAWRAKFHSAERKIDLNDWLMRQKPIKTVFKDYCRQILTTGSTMCLTILNKLMHYFKGLCEDALQGYVNPTDVKKIVVQVMPTQALPPPPVNAVVENMDLTDDDED